MSFSNCYTGSKEKGINICHPSLSFELTCKIPSCVKSRWLNHADVMTANFCRNGPKIGLKGHTKIRNIYIPITRSFLGLPDVPIQPLPFEQLIGSYPGSWLVNPNIDPHVRSLSFSNRFPKSNLLWWLSVDCMKYQTALTKRQAIREQVVNGNRQNPRPFGVPRLYSHR